MSFKILKKFLTIVIAISMTFVSISAGIVSAHNKKNYLPLQESENQNNLQVNPRLVYLAEHNIAIMSYMAFINNSGLNFNQMREILDNDNSLNFEYLYELSILMGNRWISYKHEGVPQGDVFLKLLNVVKALHIKVDELESFDGFLTCNNISLYDVFIFVNKGFSEDQKKELSIPMLLKYTSKFAAETCNDFWSMNFQREGYSGYDICANILELSGWNFNKIEKYLGDRYSGLQGLECIVEFSNRYGFNTENVVEIFKESDIAIKDVKYLYNEIVVKRGFDCRDFVDSVNEFEGYSARDYVRMADDAKKSGRKLLDEVKHDCEEYEKKHINSSKNK